MITPEIIDEFFVDLCISVVVLVLFLGMVGFFDRGN